MTGWKKLLCAILAVVMLLGIWAVPAAASDEIIAEEETDIMNSSSSSMSFDTSGTAIEEEIYTYIPPASGEDISLEPEDPIIAPVGTEILHEVPQYFQTDYADVPYSDGTVATSGCSMVSIAMVASYLRGEDWSPADLARRFGNYEASNIQRMECAATVLDLPYKKVFQWHEVVTALRQGKIAIVLVDKRTHFTTTQHFLVLTGISYEGNIYLNDSYEPNYSKWELKEGFENGFDPEMIYSGFSGAWIFDEYVPPEIVETRYPGVVLTEEEKYLLASIIWLESRGECFEGQQAIAEIVLNRLVSDQFPNTVRDVIYAEGQFSTTKFLDTAKPGEIQYKAIESALTSESVLPKDVYFFGRTARNPDIWGQIGGHVFCY